MLTEKQYKRVKWKLEDKRQGFASIGRMLGESKVYVRRAARGEFVGTERGDRARAKILEVIDDPKFNPYKGL